MTERYVVAIDQGTTSTRCIVFDRRGQLVSLAQQEHKQFYPKPGWVEHDAAEIWRNVERLAPQALRRAGITLDQVAAVGIANQRETTVLWDRRTGAPIGRALVWQDTRTDSLVNRLLTRPGADGVQQRAALPLSTYFAGPRLRWMLDHTPGLQERAERGEVLFGTMETWLIWNLTGGLHVTDVTNASRTNLLDVHTLDWSPESLRFFGIPRAMLPEVRPSVAVFGTAAAAFPGYGSERRSAISRRRSSARPASSRARPSARTAPGASCCSTPARSSYARTTACSARSRTRSAARRPTSRWRARSPSPARSSSGSATSWS
ncbi:hypothetical protein Asp14428_77700 [Actinoplanes sp. NBRC 14428]|nr:hypothetical protein Asp14428_77700 [Actinoplanes sp. NBRC 14428]